VATPQSDENTGSQTTGIREQMTKTHHDVLWQIANEDLIRQVGPARLPRPTARIPA